MSGKGKRRREARRRARQRHEAEGPPPESGAAAEAAEPAPQGRPGPERQAVRSAAAGEPHGRAARKRAKRTEVGAWQRVSRMRISGWMIGLPVVVGGVIVVAVLILTSGSSGTSGGSSSAGTPTPDPRVAGLTPDVSLNIEAGGAADDAFFSPNSLSAGAGDVVEIVVTNSGSVSHNLRVAGLDDEYETADDFEMPPNVIQPGETQKLVVKIDPPGTYRFRCDFHPLLQTGTLVLE